MKNIFALYNLISQFIFNFIISISFFSFNKCDIIKVLEAFKQSGKYVRDCEYEALFENKTCVPISTSETDITNMFEKIVFYYKNISIDSKIIIGSENINYTITTNILEKDNNGLLNLGDYYTNSLKDIDDYYYIVLINIKDSNYMTTSSGIRIFKSSGEKDMLSKFCGKTIINIGIPIEIYPEDKTLYKNIKKEYGYDLFNSEDPFYNDKCTKFTAPFDSDITLKLRNELYLLYAKISCSDKCLYDTFDENNDTIYCNCNFAGESKKENELETERFNIKVVKCISKSFNDIMKNYIFIAICILSFSFIICFFITCISLSKTISEYSKEFSGLKKKFSKYYSEVIKKEAKIKEAKEKEKLSQKEKLKVKNKIDLNEIEEEEDNDDNEDENDKDDENDEQEEESDEGNNKQLKINKNKNNQNNINPMNNPFFNSVPNNSMTPYNAYDQFFLYQMYQQYMMNYMHNLYFNNNTINNNRNDDEDEDEADEEDNKRNGNRKKKSFFNIKLDYNKLKEYALKMQKVKEQKKNNLKNKKKRAKKMKYLNDEFDKNFNIEIFKKKKEQKNIKNDKEKNIKLENKKGKEKEKNLKIVNAQKKFKIGNEDKKSADYKNRNIIRKQIHSKSLKLDNKLNSKLKEKNNKPNPPKNSISSERELLSSRVKSNDESKIISQLNNEYNEKEDNENNEVKEDENENEKEKEEESNEEQEEDNNEEKEEDNNEEKEEEENSTEKKEDSNEEEASSSQKKEDSQQEEENEDSNTEKKEDNTENNENIESDNNNANNINNIKIHKKNNTGEKEKKLLKLNLNSNGDNSTISNIINNSKNSNIEKESDNKQNSISTKKDNNENIEIKFGSDEFHKMLNKIPEKKKMEFFKESELNHLEYKYVCDIDGRMFFQIYSAMLKEQNSLILSLSLCGNDYSISSLKFSFLCVQIILYLTVSAIFFNDELIDNIFLNENKFKISYMLKPMAYTYLICLVITTLLKALIKINNNVVDIKNEAQTYEEGINAIRLKLIFYFIIGFIINIIGFCLLTSFCSVFINTKIKLIKCASFAFLFNFIVSVIFCFIITSFRTCSMNNDKSKTSCLYTTSNILTYL